MSNSCRNRLKDVNDSVKRRLNEEYASKHMQIETIRTYGVDPKQGDLFYSKMKVYA